VLLKRAQFLCSRCNPVILIPCNLASGIPCLRGGCGCVKTCHIESLHPCILASLLSFDSTPAVFCARQVNRVLGKILIPVTNKIRKAAVALLLLICVVTLTSAFNLPNRSPDLRPRLASLRMVAKPVHQRTTLTFTDRVAYQRAIEEVYWHHRIWPKQRPDPKPSLDEVMPSAQLKTKVADYLRNSQALEDYWQEPLSAEQLQAEMERMAQHTKQPEVLHELFEALGNDPFVIAECLARPILAERLVSDLTRSREPNGIDTLKSDARTRSYSQNFAKQDDVSRISDAVLSTRESFRSWGAMHRRIAFALYPCVRRISLNAQDEASSTNLANAAYRLPKISIPLDCADNTWTATTTVNAPDAREYHTAVWTGSEVIIWGGFNFSSGTLNSGARYNPATDSWIATSTTNAPTVRTFHTAVWTGTEMIVWGGYNDGNDLNTGGRYDPTTDGWTATSIVNAPTGRESHTAVWTGNEMIVWGGLGCGSNCRLNTGGRYNPAMDSWTATSATNAPSARWDHTALWTGSEMIVWGGTNQTIYLNTGGRYNPASNSWTVTSTVNVPIGRIAHTAVWTGSEMIVWGGVDSTFNDTNTGGRYNPSSDSWTATSLGNAPLPRDSHSAVWTGSEMIVWGGHLYPPGEDLNSGGKYSSADDSWTPTNTANAPLARDSHTAVWTGSEMIVWGGKNINIVFLNTGGRYCAQSQAPMVQSAFSRKTHGAAGTFDVPLPLTGNVGIECRSGGATNDYQMIINFANPVTVGSALVTSGTGSVSSFSVSGSQVTVNLTGVTNAQRITVTLFNVNDGTHMGNVPVSMGVLIGDVNGNAVVNASDVSLTKSQVGQPVSSSNFREDVNANGSINAADVAQVKANVGTALPP
jgi:N-acetylneuraminic acid mutarotase